MVRLIRRCALKHLLFAISASFPFLSLIAQGDLQVYPKRVVFDGSKKSQELSLANSGKDTARYVISVIQIRMKEDGSFETISQPDAGQNFADKNIRFFPRTVVLAPNEAQTVKIQVIKYNELSSGEYRSHIYLRAEPERQPLGEEKSTRDSSSISVRLVPVFGISIPVIIRVGASTTEINLSRVSFQLEKDTIPSLQMNLNRSGNMSVYGDIKVDHISAQGKVTRVGLVKGVAVYAPNTTRAFRLALEKNAAIDYHKGSLHVVYTDASGQTEKLAQEQIFLR